VVQVRVEELHAERDRLEAECQEMGATQSRIVTLEAMMRYCSPTRKRLSVHIINHCSAVGRT
jgi:hypothetical protein